MDRLRALFLDLMLASSLGFGSIASATEDPVYRGGATGTVHADDDVDPVPAGPRQGRRVLLAGSREGIFHSAATLDRARALKAGRCCQTT